MYTLSVYLLRRLFDSTISSSSHHLTTYADSFAHKIEKLFGSQLDDKTKDTYGLSDPQNLLFVYELLDFASEETIHLVLEALLQLNKVPPLPLTLNLTSWLPAEP